LHVAPEHIAEVVMSATSIFEIEFPRTGPAFERAMNAIACVEHHMGEDGFRLESLVRHPGGLFEPWEATANAPTAYAVRIHLDPLMGTAVQLVCSELLVPLTAHGVQVRAVKQAA
jgi:hypothetical protein